jgi:energy-coupling factor transport system ATP-binding protein
MSLLEVQNASYTYPQSEKPALANVTVSISEGEYVALVGMNGSGKSTFARLAAGFITPDSGTVTLDKRAVQGIVFQQPKEQIVAGVVERDTAFGPQNLSMSKAEIELRTMECLSVTDLMDKALSRTFELSLGQTQRLAFSGILALFPDFLILDEATAMLDPASRTEIISLIDQWHKKGHTVLHVTHDKDEALAADRVIVLDKGTVSFDGSSDCFRKNSALVSSLFGDDSWYIKKNEAGARLADTTALAVENLSFSYQNYSGRGQTLPPVFSQLSFSLKKGTLTALTGPSGCGKSTLLECIAGLLAPKEGTIAANARPVLALQESEAALFETFAADDVAFGPGNNGVSGKALLDRVKKSMMLAGIPYETFGNRQTFTLSGGEKRKLSLAGIIALDSDIMLFDEPTAGLDPQSRREIMQTLRTLTQNGKTVLFSTHRMEEAAFADRELTWSYLAEKAKQGNQTNQGEPDAALAEFQPLPNSEMIASLQKTGASFMAPPQIPHSCINSMAPILKYLVFLALFITSIAVRPLWLCAVLLVVCALYSVLAKYPLKHPLGAYMKFFPWLLLFALFQFLFYPAAQGEVLFVHWGMFTISRSKIILSLCMFVRTFSAVFCIGTFVYSTSEREIMDGLDSLLKPLALLKVPVRHAVLVVGIIFRFIPLLLDDAAGILKTQLVRGGLGKAHGFAKIKTLLPLLVPLMLRTFRKAQSFADALTARYFS